MHELTGYSILQGAVFSTQMNASSAESLLEAMRERFEGLPYSLVAVQEALNRTLETLDVQFHDTKISSQTRSLAFLLKEDLERVVNGLPEIDLESASEATCYKHMEQYLAILNDLGVEQRITPRLFVVDEFPDPFSSVAWSAATFFYEDEKQYNVERGVYLRRDRVAPRRTEALIAHELIHSLLDRPGKSIPRRLEEGICDLIGSCYLGGTALGFDVSATIIRNYLYNTPSTPLRWLYAQNLAQATQVYIHYGMDGLAEIIRSEQSRDFIAEIELSILQGKVNHLSLPCGHWDPQLTLHLNILAAMPIHFTLTPLAYFVAQESLRTGTISGLAKEYSLSKDDVDAALRELLLYPLQLQRAQKKGKKKVGVDFSEITTNYFDTKTLRYDADTASLHSMLIGSNQAQ